MQYRAFGRTGEEVSILGFGCMRLPIIDGRQDAIDVPLATEMLHYAIDHGVNYVDTAYPYHSGATMPGMSETFVGEALAGGYRDRVLVATKLPSWLVQKREDMDAILDDQLGRMKMEHIDCYLLHGVDKQQFERLASLGALEFLEVAKKQGRIRFAGFSFHDDGEAFAPIVDAFDWDFCQIQYNYMDTGFQAGAAGLAYASDRGLGVIVMEPLKGGRLAVEPPSDIKALWGSASVKRTPVAWALRFVWDDPRVSTLLSGMGTVDQVVENVALASEGRAGSLDTAELAVIDQVKQAYRERTVVDCTACRYCLPCPEGIDIPKMLGLLNDTSLFGDLENERRSYQLVTRLGHTAAASACIECGECLEKCPQGLDVPHELAEVAKTFE